MKLRPLTTVSASSITTFLLCPRKWYYRYVLGEKGPQTPAMLHGTAVHADIEAYYRRESADLTYPESIEAQSRGFMPGRSQVDPDLVEFKAADLGLEIDGLKLLGFIDLPYFRDDTGELAVIDWKTRSALHYAPDAVALLEDIQGRLYGHVGFKIADSLGIAQKSIQFQHVNMIRVDHKSGRHSPKSSTAKCTYLRSDLEDWIENDIVTIIREMKAVASQEHPRLVKQNMDGCFAYGPCEYRDPIASMRGRSCYDTPYQAVRVDDLTPEQGEKPMDLMKLRKLQKQEAAPTQAPKEEAPAPAAATEGTMTPLERAKADFLDNKPGFDLFEYGLGSEDKRAFVQFRMQQTQKAQIETAENPIPAVNPPDAAPDEEPVDLDDMKALGFDFETVTGVGPATAKNVVTMIREKNIGDLKELLAMDLSKTVAGVGPGTEAKIKDAIRAQKNWTPDDPSVKPDLHPDQELMLACLCKGYRKADQALIDKTIPQCSEKTLVEFEAWKEEQENPAGEMPTPEVPLEKKPDPVSTSTNAGGPSSISVLYIDCVPIDGTHFQSLNRLLEPAKEVVAKEEGLRYWCADKFGKGRKILVDVVLEDPSFLSGHVVARSEEEGMAQLLPEIQRFFDLVVQG